MIKIEKNQTVPENPNLRVFSTTGEYGDNDLIFCSTIENPDFALCAFSASFIKYGPIVNQFSDPLELGEALLKLDPECTHDTATLFKEEEIRRYKREKGDFTPENPVPFDEKLSTANQEEILDTNLGKKDIEEKIEKTKENIEKLDNESPLSNDTSITTPDTATSTGPTSSNATSTPIVETSTTSPSTTDSNAATSTPSELVVPEIIPEQPLETPLEIPQVEQTIQEQPLSILKKKSKRNIV